ncbi:MAG TPA: type II toxin-antitoxin system HicA family toxin [Rhodobacteraceae bacterium]|nr:type II toxin-antitoxin system HicA family toxin [Paracoccaceae bacterium]
MVSTKHTRTLRAIFETPTRASLRWSDIEKCLITLGAEISEGSGSRVRIKLNGERMTFHRPHPSPDTDKGAVVTLRKFLKNTGYDP